MPRASSRSSARASRSSRGRLVERGRQLPVGGGRDLGAGDPEGEREVDQPLLGAVVEVALDPAALGVAELHDPGPGGADLLELGPDLGLEALVLDRQAGGGGDRLDQLGLVVQGGVVDQGGDGVAVVAQDGDAAAAAAGGSSTGRAAPSTKACWSGSQ